MGVYGVLMEWLGDDLKKVEGVDGVSVEETTQAMVELAKLHAAFWNTTDPDLLLGHDGKGGGALFEPYESLEIIRGLQGGVEMAVAYCENQLKAAFGEKFSAYAKEAARTMEDWDFTGVTGERNKVLCTWVSKRGASVLPLCMV